MPDTKRMCKGMTAKGSPCRLSATEGTDYCRYHQPSNQKFRELKSIKGFFNKHREGVISFLAGTLADPVASDIYDAIKERLGMEHLIPPEPSAERQERSIEEISQHFRQDKDFDSLCTLLIVAKEAQDRFALEKLFGQADRFIVDDERRRLSHSIYNIKGTDAFLLMGFNDNSPTYIELHVISHFRLHGYPFMYKL